MKGRLTPSTVCIRSQPKLDYYEPHDLQEYLAEIGSADPHGDSLIPTEIPRMQ